MAIENWNVEKIVDSVFDQLTAAKAVLGYEQISKQLEQPIATIDDLEQHVAVTQRPFLYVTLAPMEQQTFDWEKADATEMTIRVNLLGALTVESKTDHRLATLVDNKVKDLVEHIAGLDEFRGGLATDVFPEAYVTTGELRYPHAYFRLTLRFTFTVLF